MSVNPVLLLIVFLHAGMFLPAQDTEPLQFRSGNNSYTVQVLKKADAVETGRRFIAFDSTYQFYDWGHKQVSGQLAHGYFTHLYLGDTIETGSYHYGLKDGKFIHRNFWQKKPDLVSRWEKGILKHQWERLTDDEQQFLPYVYITNDAGNDNAWNKQFFVFTLYDSTEKNKLAHIVQTGPERYSVSWFYPSGKLKETYYLKFYPVGAVLLSERERVGRYVAYYDDGKIKTLGQYSEFGERSGIWITRDEQGKKRSLNYTLHQTE